MAESALLVGATSRALQAGPVQSMKATRAPSVGWKTAASRLRSALSAASASADGNAPLGSSVAGWAMGVPWPAVVETGPGSAGPRSSKLHDAVSRASASAVAFMVSD